MYGTCTPTPIDHRCMEYQYITYISHIAQCRYIKSRCTPLKLIIDVWNTAIPKNIHR